MRAKISDQDLTDYALNDGLSPRERLYVESMLGVSEECRNDVYRMLDLSQLLEEGFEEQEAANATCLTAVQREQLLMGQPGFSGFAVRPFLRKAAATLSLAACVAIFLANPRLWQVENHARTVVAVSSEVSRMVSEAIASDKTDIASWVNPPTVSQDESDAFIQTSGESVAMPKEQSESAGCTPPSLTDASSLAAGR